jgi:hypothetical protein
MAGRCSVQLCYALLLLLLLLHNRLRPQHSCTPRNF